MPTLALWERVVLMGFAVLLFFAGFDATEKSLRWPRSWVRWLGGVVIMVGALGLAVRVVTAP